MRLKTLIADNYICRACGFGGSELDAGYLEADHIVPRSKGGKNTLENFQCLCAVCNKLKSNKIAFEFPVRTGSVECKQTRAHNQKVVEYMFTIGVKNNDMKSYQKKLK